MTKAELTAWRNKGYEDGEKRRPVSPTLEGQPASARSAYFDGRRCAEREVARA